MDDRYAARIKRTLVVATLVIAGCSTAPVPTLPLYKHFHIPPSPVAVVVSGDKDTYRELTDTLAMHMVRTYALYLLDDPEDAPEIEHAIWALQASTVVAVGAPALDLASRLDVKDVVYAQVFNPPTEHRGVSPIPPFGMQLDHWKRMSPEMSSIGVIGSAEMQDLIEQLQVAANESGLKLVSREVKSDREALQAFRAMVPQIDGFVFLPDEQVLSPQVIQKVMAHGARNERQILVYSPIMFQLGATMYVSAQQADIAEQIVALVDDPTIKTLPLTRMLTKVRHQVASSGS